MSSDNGFTLVDFTVPTRDNPISHPTAESPLCEDCKSLDLCFFNPLCSGCQDILLDSKTTIPELFAVMRQWVPQTQRNMASLSREILRRGANINDRDGLTDLTLLHYACKSGTTGVGNVISATNLVNSLINKGADIEARCRWTNMNALHYTVFFDVPDIVQALVETKPALVTSTCSEFNGGSALHISATNISLGSAKVLLSHGADGSLRDRNGKLPYECIPEVPPKDQVEAASELLEILKNAAENPPPKPKPRNKHPSTSFTPTKPPTPTPRSPVPRSPVPPQILEPPKSPSAIPLVSKSPVPSHSTISSGATSGSSRTESPIVEDITMATLGLKIGERIVIDASSSKPKYGTIRYGGTPEFASGQWAGIELDDDIGKNDGSCAGIRYFSCKMKYGLFVPMHRIGKPVHLSPRDKRRSNGMKKGRDRLSVGMKAVEQTTTDLEIGERVIVSGSRTGVLRFSGTVRFATGFWLGVELDQPHGKNDGSKSGVRYFRCKPNHGVFVLPSKVQRAPHTNGRSTGSDTTDHPLTSSSEGSSSTSASTNTPSPHASPRLRKKPSSRSTSRTKQPKMAASSSSAASSHHSSSSPTPLSLALSPDPVLEEGMSVFVSGELGTLRFIGNTEFAEGVWLGIEMRRPHGKNDGSVRGKRYFTCRPNYGIFVKPERATHRGINCSRLIQNYEKAS